MAKEHNSHSKPVVASSWDASSFCHPTDFTVVLITYSHWAILRASTHEYMRWKTTELTWITFCSLRNAKTSVLYGCQQASSSPPNNKKSCPFIPDLFPMEYCSNSHPLPPYIKAYRCHSLSFRTVAWPCSIRSSSQTLAFFHLHTVTQQGREG